MSVVAEKTEITPEDLLAMPDEKAYELVDGQLVERNVSVLSSWVGGRVLFLMGKYLEDHPIGLVFGADIGYQCYPDKPRKVRKADVSYIRHGRLPGDWQTIGFVRTPPDLVVEVVSPNDLSSEVEQKVNEYLNAGVALIWVVDPEVRVVRVHRADFTSAYLTEKDELSGEAVLPGFHCRVASLFPPSAAVAPKDTGR